MQYQALYRKHRPQRFDEVVGQDHVTSTLSREVIEGKVAHAYLFTGPRGTGKTTSARLLAKALNCPNRGDDGEPCNTCPSCLGIIEGTSLDVIELDAASHNKVEDIREIRVNVGTVAAAAGARRVYILDEAHMLSRAASNALLKTLEEPPEHVVFVLATTEPYKLLDTIRSRTQRFDFQPVPTEILIGYLAEIADREGFTYDHAALGAVTAHAGGSVRDAMSLLEQVAALGAGTVATDGVARALGLADADSFARFLEATHDGDAAAVLALVAELASRGADLRRFVADAIAYLRGVFLTQYAANVEAVVDAPIETIERWRRHGALLASAEVLRSIDVLSEALVHLRDGREERLVLEIASLKLARPEIATDLEGVTARLDRLERDVRTLRKTPTPSKPTASTPPVDAGDASRPFAASGDATVEQPPQTPQTPAATDADVDAHGDVDDADGSTPQPTGPEPASATTAVTMAAFEKAWPAIVAAIRHDVGPRRQALLREAAPTAIDGDVVIFEVAAHMHFHLEQLKTDAELAAAISSEAERQLGTAMRVEYRSSDAASTTTVDETEVAIPDKDDLVEAEGDDDPATTVLELLGGEIVEDTTEDSA